MIVIDASAVAELLLQTDAGARVERRIFSADDEFHAPHLLDVEVVSALRRLVLARELSTERAEQAIEDYASLRIVRHQHLDFIHRAWQLRRNLSAYDAVYVALAESLNATLVTCDRPLGSAPGHSARVDVIR